MQECLTRPQALHSCSEASLFWRILRPISRGGNTRHFFLLPCCWCGCLEGTFTRSFPFTHSPVLGSPEKGCSGTVSSRYTGNNSGAAKFLLACGGESPGENALKREMSFLEFFHFNLCFTQTSILEFEIYWWLLYIQTAADISPSRLKGTPRTRRWSLLPHALIHTQTKQY